MVCIGRPVDGISLNGLEYVYHDGDGAGFGVLARFEDEAHARDFLYQHGFSDDDIENQGIMFVDESMDIIRDVRLSAISTTILNYWRVVSKMDEENKQKICDLLLPALQATRAGSKLVNLVYTAEPHKENVTAVFQGGWVKFADVTADSGTALIYDVMRQIF